ncbi:hypothetical protein ACFL1G_03930 [Planctomycetota bacterium]
MSKFMTDYHFSLINKLRASNKMPLHSSGLFFGWLRCRGKIVLDVALATPVAIFPLPPCHPKKRSLSVQQFILLEALNLYLQVGRSFW